MGFFTALSALAGIASVANARSARKRQEAAMRRQETTAKEAAKLDTTNEDTGADIALGTESPASVAGLEVARTSRNRQRKTSPVGGVLPVGIGL